MFKRFALIPVAALFSIILCGCTVVSELPPEEVAKQGESPEFKLGREMLIAFLKDDADGFVSQLSPDVQKVFNAKKFHDTRAGIIEKLGEPESFRYLTTLELVALKPNIWKVRFKRASTRTGKEFHQEVLFRIITAEADGKVSVVSFNFI